MDDKNLEQQTDESSYKIIRYPAAGLPASYYNMVVSRYLKSLRYGNDYLRLIDQDFFFATFHKHIEHLLSRQTASVWLAVLSDNQDIVFGFAITEPKTLHFIHVPKDYRKQGIARSIAAKLSVDIITHLTKTGLCLWNKKYPNAKFIPEVL